MRLRLYVAFAAVICTALGLTAAGAAVLDGSSGSSAAACPTGYELHAVKEAAEQRAGIREVETLHKDVLSNSMCVNAAKHPEKLVELILRQEGLETVRSAPYHTVAPGAYGNALREAKAAPKRGQVKGTGGTWEDYGKGPLIVNDPNYPSVNGLGLVDNMGRLDSLEYDPVSKRLFAAKGTGGIWLSEDMGGSWRSIGDALPSQVVGAVGWTSANGGTLVAISGDGTYGSGGYTGYGAFYSTDLGATWQKATGIPDGALGFAIEADPTNPSKVYAGTSYGLYRSTDGGKSYTNVRLPTGECAGVEGGGKCQLANMVTDVVVRGAGGVNGDVKPGTVVAAVGWRAGQRKNSDGTVQSPNNGVYRSETGDPGSFTKLAATGFTPQERIGRIEFGEATGAQQDKDYLYAIVQDAAALNGQLDVVDASGVPDPRGAQGTVLNGVYVSKDFGATWLLMADDNAIAKNPATGSALVGTAQALGYEPGIQAWYNEWIAPDPTRQDGSGVPTRLAFGLEEVWQNEVSAPMNTPTAFKVIGRYFSGDTCLFLSLGLPECPPHREDTTSTTTHPDQQEGLWVPDGSGGVTLAVGNDGGFYRQHVAAGQELRNGGWGDGNQTGFSTLLPYDVAMANDGTVWAGLQDNGHMKIDSRTRKQYETYGGDGTFAEVDPADSDIAYEAYVFNAMRVTIDGGTTWRSIDPKVTGTRFVNPFEMDPLDATHLVTAGNEVVETTFGPETAGGHDTDPNNNKSWVKVFDLGTAKQPGNAAATPSTTDPANGMSAIDVVGDAVYVGYCGVCDILNQSAPFQSGIATNVGGDKPAKRMSSDGWHIARAQGLPERFITSVAIDPADATRKTVYVTLGGYSRRWVPPGTLQDQSTSVGEGHLFKSTDGGETFTDVSGNLPDVPATWVTVRGRQLIVGTDVGVFANDTKGGTKFAYLDGLPVVPVSTMNLKPDDPNLLVVATYGRGVWTYCFTEPLTGTTAGCPITPKPLPEQPAAPVGQTLAGPFGFELTAEGWTTTTTDALGVTTFKRSAPGATGSGSSFGVAPYTDLVTTTLVSPAVSHPGGWTFVSFDNLRNTEPAFDFMHVEWSADGGQTWNASPWKWSPEGGNWVPNTGFDGLNHDFPAFSAEKVAFNAPAGTLRVRFRLSSDELISSPAFTGTHVDNVVISR